MSDERGLGYKPDPDPTRLQRLGSGYRGAKARIRSVALPSKGGFAREPWHIWQNGYEACTGFAMVKGVHAMTGEKLSPYVPYFFARLYDLGLSNMADIGARPSLVTLAAEKHGAPPYEGWHPKRSDFDINREPGYMARMSGQKFKIDLRPIYATGSRLVERVVDSLNRKQAVVLTVRVDESFSKAEGVIPGSSGSVRGKHLVFLDRFRTEQRRLDWEVRADNSWRGWGVDGLQWLSAARVAEAPWAAFIKGVRRL